MRIEQLILLIMLVITSSQTNAEIKGEWSLYCDSTTNVYFDGKDKHPMTILTSQIYIDVEYKEVQDNNSVHIYFSRLRDLGTGGMRLRVPWESLSMSEPIGLFRKTSKTEAKLHWYGFVDQAGNKVDVMSDFSTDEVNHLERCR